MTSEFKQIMDNLNGFSAILEPEQQDDFYNITQKMNELHAKKGKDYGTDGDPYANIRFTAEFLGVKPSFVCMMHISNKIFRIRSFIHNGRLENESVEDSLIDLSNYSTICQVFLIEEAADASQDQRETV